MVFHIKNFLKIDKKIIDKKLYYPSDSSTIDEKIEEKIYDLKELIDKNKEIKYRKVY